MKLQVENAKETQEKNSAETSINDENKSQKFKLPLYVV